MSVRIEPHAEPIPGYRLIERLGSGGFGEVWKAVAPGGIHKAIKFVYGEISEGPVSKLTAESAILGGGSDSDRVRAAQEFKSLDRVKGVRHPYLLSLERYDIIEGQLIIVMELAERTLWDRYKECRLNGLPGIPREELLGYLEEAAEVLDLMNTEHQLQHLDIKPQNLFVVSRHVKVADFGLVKDLANQPNAMATITGGVTPVYAAPESFLDEKVSRQSDQYSLAIVYQELLTGQRPIAGATMNQLYLHHLQNLPPDLSPLPTGDRPAMARALSRRWEDRNASCLEFIQLLRKTTTTITTVESDPKQTGEPLPTSERMDTESSQTASVRGGAGRVKPADPNFSAKEAFFGHRLSSPRATTAPPKPNVPTELAAAATSPPLVAPRARRVSPGSMNELPGLLQPALIVGLGQLGVDTIAQLRRRLCEEFGHVDALPAIRILAIDTDSETIQQASNDTSRSALRAHEIFLAKLQRPNYYIKTRDGKLPTDSWLNSKLLYRIPREQNHAGLRALGRLAFVDNFRPIARRLETELQAICSTEILREDASTGGLGLRSARPRVYVATSLTGNTGSGMFLDVAYLMRKLLRDQGHEEAEIIGLFFVPRAHSDSSGGVALQNTHASLLELQHFSRDQVNFEANYETAASSAKDSLSETGAAFDRCILLPLPESKGKFNPADNLPVVALAADFLCRDLTSILGLTLDEQRRQKFSLSDERMLGGPLLQSLGMYRVLWPRHALLEQCARGMCRRLVARWMSKDATPIAEAIKPWTQERWEALGMRSEDLIERFQRMAEHALQQKPEQLLAAIIGPLHEAIFGDSKEARSVDFGVILSALAKLDALLGHPDETLIAAAGNIEPSILERTFADIAHAVADECEQKLAELAVTLLEDPNYRLAGAEEALRQFCTAVDQTLRSQETLAKELTEKAKQLHQRLVDLVCPPAGTTGTASAWLRRKGAPSSGATIGDLFELVRTYAKTRYHGLVLTHLDRVYIGLRGHLSDQIREVGFCRQRLSELHGLFAPAEGPRVNKAAVSVGEAVLYPVGCRDLNDAIEHVNQEVSADDLLTFDQRVQAWINTHCQALLEVCMGSATSVRNLAPAMAREAEAFLNTRLRGTSVADMYLTRKRGEQDAATAIADDLQRCFDEAVPEFGRTTHANEISVVSLPGDEPGKQLQEIMRKSLPELKILMTERQDEMVFYREIFNLQWKNLEQLGPIAKEAYEKRSAADPASLHSREDIGEW